MSVCVRCKRSDKEAVVCDGCARAISDKAPGQKLREWTQRQKLLGRLSPDVVAALEQAAEDIEQGWPV